MRPDSSPAPKKRRPNRAMGIIVLTLLAIFGLISYALVRNQHHAADCQQAINNMRSLSTAFLEFDQEYGAFPCDKTATEVIESTGSDLILTGPHSNPYFRHPETP